MDSGIINKRFRITRDELTVIHRLLKDYRDEFTVKVGENESVIMVVDITHVCLLEIILHRKQGDHGYEFGIDLDHFGIFKTLPIHPYDELRLDMDKGFVYAGNPIMELKLPLFDTNMLRLPGKPDLNKKTTTEILVEVEKFQPLIDIYNRLPGLKSPLFMVDEESDRLKVRYHEDVGLRMEIECSYRASPDRHQKSMYDLQFLVPFLSSLRDTGFQNLSLFLNTSFPLHIWTASLNIEVNYFQAPVIEDKDYCRW